MRRFLTGGGLLAFAVLLLSGCAENSLVMKGQLGKLQQQQLAMSNQNQQFQVRADALDRDNQELETLVAQLRQQTQVSQDQLAATRDQLRGVMTQLDEARTARSSADNKVQALTASMRRRGGVSITPNNSLLQTLPAVNIPGVQVRRDGDVIRLELPGAELFESGGAQLKPGAASLVGNVASELTSIYPDQIIGIEGHTDTDPINSRQYRNNHELSVARAMAVYEMLATRTRLGASQLFIVGHGPNHPIVSNATLAGKKRNRRVELVVYPEKKG